MCRNFRAPCDTPGCPNEKTCQETPTFCEGCWAAAKAMGLWDPKGDDVIFGFDFPDREPVEWTPLVIEEFLGENAR